MKKYFVNNHNALEGRIAVIQIYLSKIEGERYSINNVLHNRTTLIWVHFQKDIRSLIRECEGNIEKAKDMLYDEFVVDFLIPVNVCYELIGNTETDQVLKTVQDFILSAIRKYK